MAYKPIEAYGLIGNMRSAALIGDDGSLDWLCLPAFDSPSLFCAILDDRRGGSFRIWADGETAWSSQLYWPDTNVLMTRLRRDGAVAELLDFMPIRGATDRGRAPDVVRHVVAESGTIRIRMRCRPAFNYARDDHEIERIPGGVLFTSPRARCALRTHVPLEIEDDGSVTACVDLGPGERVSFGLQYVTESQEELRALDPNEASSLLEETIGYWWRWVGQCNYTGRWQDMVRRSALALKMLTYEPTGAIIAAPTTSLPEHVGGTRNWDYRYTWLRDAGYTVYAFLRVGFTEEATRFMEWLLERAHEIGPDGALQPLYGIDGRHHLPEETLDHLEGYRGSRPVRIGNDAYRQVQLDISGSLMDAAYLFNKYASPIGYAGWQEMRRFLGWVCRTWDQPDDGIWEVRGGARQFVFSKVMCWVALDRGIRVAEKRSFPGAIDEWRRVRDTIYEEIMTRGWNPTSGTFRQHFDSDELDASCLLMPLVFFIAPNDERMLSTMAAIRRPRQDGGLLDDFMVKRYNTEQVNAGVGGPEGAFNMSTFWLVEALTRAGASDRRLLDDAEILFDRMLRCASPLGLLAEETGANLEALGNYPQAFTHLALISAAFNLDRVLG